MNGKISKPTTHTHQEQTERSVISLRMKGGQKSFFKLF